MTIWRLKLMLGDLSFEVWSITLKLVSHLQGAIQFVRRSSRIRGIGSASFLAIWGNAKQQHVLSSLLANFEPATAH